MQIIVSLNRKRLIFILAYACFDLISEIRNTEIFDQKKFIFIKENSLDNNLFENTFEMTAQTEHDVEKSEKSV